jgi:hypothetical protein
MHSPKYSYGKFVSVNARRAYGGWEASPLILNLDTTSGEWSAFRPAQFIQRETEPFTHRIEG